MERKVHITVLSDGERKDALDLPLGQTTLKDVVYDPETIFDPFKDNPDIIICFPSQKIPSVELAQALRMNYSEVPIYYVSHRKDGFNKKLLVKNGFSDAFYLPWENSELSHSLNLASNLIQIGDMKDYVPISVVELKEKTVLGFSTKIHLPMNNKFVQFTSTDEEISEKKLDKLLENNVDTLFIHKDDQEKFSSYTKARSPGNKSMSEAERKKRLHSLLREIVGEFLIQDNSENTFEKSRELISKVKSLVQMAMSDKKSGLGVRLEALIGKETSFYIHSTNVATYSGYFSLFLGLSSPENVALAGLFHDLGKLNSLESDAELKPEDIYKLHPQRTIDLIKANKISLSDDITKGILQHHEWINGQGFPKNLSMNRIAPEAKVVAIADAFDKLTSKREAYPMSAVGAIKHLMSENEDPIKMKLDSEMLRKLFNELQK